MLILWNSSVSKLEGCDVAVVKFDGYKCAEKENLTEDQESTIYLVEKEGEQAVLKVSKAEYSQAEMGNHFLENLKHPNIIKIHQTKAEGNFVYTLMEYAAKKDLASYLMSNEDFEKNRKAKLAIFLNVINAAVYLKENKIVHANIAPENIVLTEALEPKLVGFSLAMKDGTLNTLKGRLEYIDAEMIVGYEPNKEFQYTSSNDVYALGVLLYFLFNKGQTPFGFSQFPDFAAKVMVGKYPVFKDTDLDILKISHEALQNDKSRRISLEDLKVKIEAAIESEKEEKTSSDFYLSNKSGLFVEFADDGMTSWDFCAINQGKIIFGFILLLLLIPAVVYLMRNKSVGKTEVENNQELYA